MRVLILTTILFCIAAAFFFYTVDLRYLFVAYLGVAAATVWLAARKWRYT